MGLTRCKVHFINEIRCEGISIFQNVKVILRITTKYMCMDYVRKWVNTRFELASTTLQDKWLDEQF